MNFEAVKELIQGLIDLARYDHDAAMCLLDWGRCTLGRYSERCKAQRERREPLLEPIELRPPSLADLGVRVVGCSGCRVTPKNRKCPGCGNSGVAPIRRTKRKKPV